MTDARSTENAAPGGTCEADCSPRDIGTICNYYGCLTVKAEDGKCYWGIENHDGVNWEEIPASLFRALMAYEDHRANGANLPRSEAE